MKKQLTTVIRRRLHGLGGYGLAAAAVGVIGIVLLVSSHALTTTANIEAENGTVGSCAASTADSSASGGGAVKFGTCTGSSTNPAADAGAVLPINYSLASLSGSVYYVATTGSDANNGTVGSPFATLSKAISTAAAGSNIVIRGGTYRNQSDLNISKTLKIISYPGETPIFNGAAAASSGWTAASSLSYHAYTPQPVTDGQGITYTTCQNQTASCMGKYPDQAWVGTQQLQQVATQGEVTDGKFWVDSSNNRLYITTADLNKGSVEISDMGKFASISGASVTMKGFKIIRYSNTASDYGVLSYVGTADNALLDNMYISDSAWMAYNFGASGTDLNTHSTIQNSTILYGNRMGGTAVATDYFTLDHDDISHMNQFGEFTSSPQSGSLKVGRTWYTTVKNSKFTNDQSHAVWFDQSNYKATVANNYFSGNTGTNLFFEISDFLYATNNYIDASGSLNGIEMSGSTDTYLVNNTVVGGTDPVASYTDGRSQPGCSTDATPKAQCGGTGSDVDTYHTIPATQTWIPTINLMLNNIIGYPDGARYCSAVSAICATLTNSTASETVNTLIHAADAANGVPQTLFDGNVVANGSGKVVNINGYGGYTTLSAFASAMAGSPVNISGFEVHGLAGNSYFGSDGTPTASLNHTGAAAVPTDANINPFVPAGTKHYGVLWK